MRVAGCRAAGPERARPSSSLLSSPRPWQDDRARAVFSPLTSRGDPSHGSPAAAPGAIAVWPGAAAPASSGTMHSRCGAAQHFPGGAVATNDAAELALTRAHRQTAVVGNSSANHSFRLALALPAQFRAFLGPFAVPARIGAVPRAGPHRFATIDLGAGEARFSRPYHETRPATSRTDGGRAVPVAITVARRCDGRILSGQKDSKRQTGCRQAEDALVRHLASLTRFKSSFPASRGIPRLLAVRRARSNASAQGAWARAGEELDGAPRPLPHARSLDAVRASALLIGVIRRLPDAFQPGHRSVVVLPVSPERGLDLLPLLRAQGILRVSLLLAWNQDG